MTSSMKKSVILAWVIYVALIAEVFVFAVLAVGCAKQKAMEPAFTETPAAVSIPVYKHPASEAGPSGPVAFLRPVYFDFDQDALRPESVKTLEALFRLMSGNAALEASIEGNCDERGTAEYNYALGLRRAEQAKRRLVSLGIHPLRISVVSYGKEQLVCIDDTDQCHQLNRRADFILR